MSTCQNLEGLGGYSHWNPSHPDSPNRLDPKKLLGVPRLLPSRRKASRCISLWNSMPNAKETFGRGEYGDLEPDYIGIKEDGRSKDDLEIVEVEIIDIKERDKMIDKYDNDIEHLN